SVQGFHRVGRCAPASQRYSDFTAPQVEARAGVASGTQVNAVYRWGHVSNGGGSQSWCTSVGNPLCPVSYWLARPFAPFCRSTLLAGTGVVTVTRERKIQTGVSQPAQAPAPTVLAWLIVNDAM